MRPIRAASPLVREPQVDEAAARGRRAESDGARPDAGPARTAPAPHAPSASRRVADVLVVGGGLAGASVAYHLACWGLRVVVAERERTGSGVTARAVGLLHPPVRVPFHQLEHTLGSRGARALWELSLRSVEGMSELVHARAEARPVELDRTGGFMLAEPHTAPAVAAEYQALRRAGVPVRWLSEAEAGERTGSRAFVGGYAVEGAGAVDPGQAVRTLVRSAEERGARFLEGSTVREVSSGPGGLRVRTDRDEIAAAAVVHAAHLDGARFLGEIGGQVVPVRGQAFMTAPLPRLFQGGFATPWKANVWRQRSDGRIVASGWRDDAEARAWRAAPGVDRTLQWDLQRWFERAFPRLAPLAVEAEWSGQVGWTPDQLPLAGALPGRPGQWLATGFGVGGFALAFEAGRAIAHALVGAAAVPGAELLDPARFVGA